MRRRTRPLDEYEQQSVDVEQPIVLEVLLNATDYAYKWPKAPLAKLIRLEKPTAIPTPIILSDAVTASTTVGTAGVAAAAPSILLAGKKAEPRGSSAASPLLANAPAFTFSVTQKNLIAEKYFPGIRTASSELLRQCEHLTLHLEVFAVEEQKKKTLALQRLVKLDRAVPASIASSFASQQPLHSSSATTTSVSALDDAIKGAIYKFWLERRLASATPERPWGTPLVAGLFLSNGDVDEYFIPATHAATSTSSASSEKDEAARRAEVRRKQPLLWFLPIELPANALAVASGGSSGAAAGSSSSASTKLMSQKETEAFIALLPPLGEVALRLVPRGKNDIAAEIHDCCQWADLPVVAAAASS